MPTGPVWEPCAACPYDPPSCCPCRSVSALCSMHRSDPSHWRPIILGMLPKCAETSSNELVVDTPVSSFVLATEPPLPSISTMAKGYIRSTVRHLLAGSPIASPELQAARLSVCGTCSHLRPSDRRCGLIKGSGCGCATSLKAARLLDQCPIDAWPKPESVDPTLK